MATLTGSAASPLAKHCKHVQALHQQPLHCHGWLAHACILVAAHNADVYKVTAQYLNAAQAAQQGPPRNPAAPLRGMPPITSDTTPCATQRRTAAPCRAQHKHCCNKQDSSHQKSPRLWNHSSEHLPAHKSTSVPMNPGTMMVWSIERVSLPSLLSCSTPRAAGSLVRPNQTASYLPALLSHKFRQHK